MKKIDLMIKKETEDEKGIRASREKVGRRSGLTGIVRSVISLSGRDTLNDSKNTRETTEMYCCCS